MRRVLLLMILTVSVLLTACGKPVINEECVMNGFGNGTCSFTNTGSSEGSMCGKITVVTKSGSEKAESSNFCSGTITPNSTNQVGFNVPSTNKMCSNSSGWTEICDFTFTASSTGKSWIRYLLSVIVIVVVGIIIKRNLPTLKNIFEQNSRKCPFCAERVKSEAIICKSCGRDILHSVNVQEKVSGVEEEAPEKIVGNEEIGKIGKVSRVFIAKFELTTIWLKHLPLGGLLIMLSLLIAGTSMCMNWRVDVILLSMSRLAETRSLNIDPGVGPFAFEFLIFIACWAYPVVMLIKSKSVNFWIGIVGAVVSLVLSIFEIYATTYIGNAYKIGDGLWVYVFASVVLLVGVVLYKPSKKQPVEGNVA